MSGFDGARYLRERAAKLKKAGLCRECKAPARNGVRCAKCAKFHREAVARRAAYHKRKILNRQNRMSALQENPMGRLPTSILPSMLHNYSIIGRGTVKIS